MKTGRNLQEVLVELNRQNKAKQDFISPAQGMHLREDGHTFEINHLTTNQQEVFGTTSLFHRQVASALGIPAKYYDLMQAQKPELLAENVNSWFADKPSSYMVRSMDYGAGQVARALLSERYRRIDNMEIATSVLPLFAGNDQYEVMSWRGDGKPSVPQGGQSPSGDGSPQGRYRPGRCDDFQLRGWSGCCVHSASGISSCLHQWHGGQ